MTSREELIDRFNVGSVLKVIRNDWFGDDIKQTPKTIHLKGDDGVQFDDGSWLKYPENDKIIISSWDTFMIILDEERNLIVYKFIERTRWKK